MNEVIDPYSIHRAIEEFNNLPTQAAFEAAWSQDETEPVRDYHEPRSRATTALLVVFVGILAAVSIWFVIKLMTEQNSAMAQQQITASPSTAAEPALPTLEIIEPPDAAVIDRDSRYINLLRNRGVIVNSKDAGVQSALSLCQAKRQGYTQVEMISAVVQSNPNLDARQAPIVVGTAIETYCP